MHEIEPVILWVFIEIPSLWFTRTYINRFEWRDYVLYGRYYWIDEAKIACKNDENCILVHEGRSVHKLARNDTVGKRFQTWGIPGYVHLKGKLLRRQIKKSNV